MDRLDVGQFADPVPLDPGEEGTRSRVIGHARVLVADRGGEEFEEAARGMLTGIGDHRRHGQRAAQRRRPGAEASTTAGRLRRSALTTTPYYR